MTSRSSLACLAAGLLSIACGDSATGGFAVQEGPALPTQAAGPGSAAVQRSVNRQADILDTVVSALARAHHADAEGQGPYGAKVSWVETDGGQRQLVQVELLVHQSQAQREGALYAD